MTELSQPQNLGINDFVKFIHDGHPEYSLIAVKAPIEQTVKAFIEIYEGQQTKQQMNYKTFRMEEIKIASRNTGWVQNLPLRDDKEFEQLARAIPFVQLRDNEWTVILRSLFNLTMDEIQDVPREAKELSARFQTKAITLMEEDTSGSIGYEFFDNGEKVEVFSHADDVFFESQLREHPSIDFDPSWEDEDENWEDEDENYDSEQEYDTSGQPRVKFINDFFTELGIYLPACFPVNDNGKPTLAVLSTSIGEIERADWVSLTEALVQKAQPIDADDAE